MKKLVLILLVLAVLFAAGVYFFSRRAPDLLKGSLERALNKTVRIQAIEYRFPGTFELQGFRVLENEEPFRDEICFSVDKVLLHVSPLSLTRSRLLITSVDVSEALVVVRNRRGKLFHALSGAMKAAPAGGPEGPVTEAAAAPAQMPLVIQRFHLGKSRFQFIDYDVQQEGFVVELDQIEAQLKRLAFPASQTKTHYQVEARLSVSGWTVLSGYDTDALFRVTDLSLPYFKPYYTQVTPADIEEGRLTSYSSLRISQKIVTANVDLELADLYFRSYETGEELFGLKADEILSFLKDSAGKLKFQLVLQWELGQRGVEKREVIRRAIEQSLKKTLLGNVGNVLERTLQKLSVSDMDETKDDLEDTLKKVKKLFR
jgi:hypothetical protein